MSASPRVLGAMLLFSDMQACATLLAIRVRAMLAGGQLLGVRVSSAV